jgi:hypothetical protein
MMCLPTKLSSQVTLRLTIQDSQFYSTFTVTWQPGCPIKSLCVPWSHDNKAVFTLSCTVTSQPCCPLKSVHPLQSPASDCGSKVSVILTVTFANMHSLAKLSSPSRGCKLQEPLCGNRIVPHTYLTPSHWNFHRYLTPSHLNFHSHL